MPRTPGASFCCLCHLFILMLAVFWLDCYFACCLCHLFIGVVFKVVTTLRCSGQFLSHCLLVSLFLFVLFQFFNVVFVCIFARCRCHKQSNVTRRRCETSTHFFLIVVLFFIVLLFVCLSWLLLLLLFYYSALPIAFCCVCCEQGSALYSLMSDMQRLAEELDERDAELAAKCV